MCLINQTWTERSSILRQERYLPRLGIWIMPNNQTSGILEDFLRFLVPQPNILFDHAKASVAAIPEGERRFKQLTEPKAVVHTWLAWQEDPGLPFGTAITARFLDPNVPEVDVLARLVEAVVLSQ